MRFIIKLILAPVLMFLFILLIIQGYESYRRKKIKRLLKVWKKKYHPLSATKKA